MDKQKDLKKEIEELKNGLIVSEKTHSPFLKDEVIEKFELKLEERDNKIRLEERKKTLEEVRKLVSSRQDNILEDDKYNHRYNMQGELNAYRDIEIEVEGELSKLLKEGNERIYGTGTINKC